MDTALNLHTDTSSNVENESKDRKMTAMIANR